jgi:RNA polymerase sigma-70 factor (ECF subfamily)
MSNDQSAVLQALLARWAHGDEVARQELIGCAYERLRRLAHVILNESFPRLKGAPALLQTTDVANEVALGMYQALAEIHPATVRDFFRLAAQRIRWLLLDRAKQLDRRPRDHRTAEPTDTPVAGPDEADPPALLTALYDQIEALPGNEREVVDLLYFHGLSQAEAASLMGVTERSVRRYWTAARLKLAQGLQDMLPPVSGGFLDT